MKFPTDTHVHDGRSAPPQGRPFVIRPRDYQVVDGDTFRLLGPKDDEGRRTEIFRIRFRSIAAPEKSKFRNPHDDLLNDILGVKPPPLPGNAAKAILARLVSGRCLHILPTGMDRHNRLLADITVSGVEGPSFEPDGSRSLERLMIDEGAAIKMVKRNPETRREEAEILPDRHPFEGHNRDMDFGLF